MFKGRLEDGHFYYHGVHRHKHMASIVDYVICYTDIWVILQELSNSFPQILMSDYGFRFWNTSTIICVLCWSICMCIFTILKLVISLKTRKQFWFYSGKGSLFQVSFFNFSHTISYWSYIAMNSCLE